MLPIKFHNQIKEQVWQRGFSLGFGFGVLFFWKVIFNMEK